MAYALSGTTITQTGTDTNWSGLAGIAGVNVIAHREHSVYDLGDRRLVIAGTQSCDPEVEELVFGDDAPFQTLTVANGGTLNIGEEIDIGAGQNRFSSGTFARFTGASTDFFRETEASFRIDTGGTLNWFGGALYANNPVAFMEGSFPTIHSQQCQIIFQTSGLQIRQRSTNLTIRGLITRGGFLTMIANAAELSNWSPFDSGNQALSFSGASADNEFFVIRNFNASGLSGQQVAFWSDVWGRLIGSGEGTAVIAGGNSDNNTSNRGLYEIRQPVELTVQAFSGGSVAGVKVYSIDTNHGERLGPNLIGSNVDYVADRIYEHEFNAGGSHRFDTDGGILTGVVHRLVGGARFDNVIYDRRSRLNDTSDTFRFVFFGYGFGIGVLDASLVALGQSSLTQTLFDDPLITEPDMAVVLTYAQINTAQRFYDAYAAFLAENFKGEETFAISRNGDIIQAGVLDVVFDANAVEAFAFDGSTITVRANTFNGAISTTGNVTLANGAQVNGAITDASGVRVQIVSDAPFNIVARRADTQAPLGFLEGVTEAIYQVPLGVNVEYAAWQLGQQTLVQTVDTAVSSRVELAWLGQMPVDTSIDVSAILQTIDVSLAPGDYSLVFNTPLELDIETMKTVIHQILGRQESLQVSLAQGPGNGVIGIEPDEIEINLPSVFLRRGASLAATDRVQLNGFLNTVSAQLINPAYVINPSTPEGLFVVTLALKPDLDPIQLASAVWTEARGQLALDHARAANLQTKTPATGVTGV